MCVYVLWLVCCANVSACVVCDLMCDVVWYVFVVLLSCVCVSVNVFVCFVCELLCAGVWFGFCVCVFACGFVCNCVFCVGSIL